jgi:hypothetical protein
MVYPVEQFADEFPANLKGPQRPPRDWKTLLDDDDDDEEEEVVVGAVSEDAVLLGRTPPRSGRYGPIDRFAICSFLASFLIALFLVSLLVRSFRLLPFHDSIRLRATRKDVFASWLFITLSVVERFLKRAVVVVLLKPFIFCF